MSDAHKIDSFHKAVEDSPLLSARYEMARAKVRADAKEIGIAATDKEISEMPSVRLAVLADAALEGEEYTREIQRLPSIIAAKAKAAEVAAIAAGESDATAKLRGMTRGERLNYSRQAEVRSGDDPHGGKTESEANALARILKLAPTARLTEWRKYQATQT